MIQKMFSLRDSKALAFLQPFFSTASGSALRALSDAVSDSKSPIGLHPEDYILYEVGSFDDLTGEVKAVSPIKMLACAADFRTAVGSPSMVVPSVSELVPEMVSNGKKPS